MMKGMVDGCVCNMLLGGKLVMVVILAVESWFCRWKFGLGSSMVVAVKIWFWQWKVGHDIGMAIKIWSCVKFTS